MAKRAASIIEKMRTHLVAWLRQLIAARERRLDYERKFYRELNDYRRAHNLPLFNPDDWKSWIYQEIDERRH
jgi:hypothetical protein